MNDEKYIRLDRMRYTKNTTASGLALLSILFDVFFFISIYESNVGAWYYNILTARRSCITLSSCSRPSSAPRASRTTRSPIPI